MKLFTTRKQQIGLVGENIDARFYKNLGHTIIERNWSSKSGEIDLIVTRESETLTFVEVKSVSCENLGKVFHSETNFNPVEQFHVKKQQKLSNTIYDYLIEKDISHETVWSVELLCVYIDLWKKKYRVSRFQNCPLGE